MSNWTEQQHARLVDLAAQGLSAIQIQAEFAGVFSRNAVISRISRKKVPWATAHKNHPPPKIKQGRAKHAKFQPKKVVEPGPTAPVLPPEPDYNENIIPLGQRCTLLELTAQTCRWPVGDPGTPDFFFCGGETERTYCSYHTRVAYQPMVRR